ncbi:hypothetical protein FQA47_008241 [Oryzias melastigma]|uniref:Uncharacterized protein n=1 Tax=Oryzias melastigma TaxID=30732 RepID=A0A834C571_ORYME|nr:hypothetical protein FQA47_008241 [Oryzias melastigma]
MEQGMEKRFDPHAPVSECLWDIHVLKALSGDLQVRDGSLFQLEESVWVFCSEERRGEDKALHLRKHVSQSERRELERTIAAQTAGGFGVGSAGRLPALGLDVPVSRGGRWYDPAGRIKAPSSGCGPPHHHPPVLTVLGCSYRCCTTAEDSERSGREEGQTGLIPTTTSSRGAARCRAESVPPGEGSPKWNALVLPPSERHLLTRCGGTAGVVNQAATVQGPATSQHQGLIAAAHAADLTGSDDIPRMQLWLPDAPALM